MNGNYPSTEKQYDINMFFVLFLFAVISCFYIYFAQQMGQYDTNFYIRQGIFFVLAFAVAFVAVHFDYEYYLNMHWVLYGFGLFLLLALDIIGPNEMIAPLTNGAVSWFTLPVIGSVQPSELMRIILIITLSAIIYRHNQRYKENATLKTDFQLLGKMALPILPVVLLLARQPDMGSVMLIGAVFVALMVVSGISYKIVSVLIGVPLLAFAAFIFLFFQIPAVLDATLFALMDQYQVNRINGWLNPFEYADEGFQTVRALTAIGAGQLLGTTDDSIYIPEAHTDFIFAVISSMHGFLGGAMVITLYFVLLYQILMIAFRSNHAFGKYLCAGFIGMLAFQIFQNIGMSLGLLPVTGFTLPLLSYGGSSVIATMFALGMIMSVRYHSKSYMFD